MEGMLTIVKFFYIRYMAGIPYTGIAGIPGNAQQGTSENGEISHIDLNAGAVYVPSTNEGNSSQLELSQKQVIALDQYLTAIKGHFKPEGNELIPGSMRNIIRHLMEEVQGLSPIVYNALPIRGSVILNWLKSTLKGRHSIWQVTNTYPVQRNMPVRRWRICRMHWLNITLLDNHLKP
jgi:hypothetical protein